MKVNGWINFPQSGNALGASRKQSLKAVMPAIPASERDRRGAADAKGERA